jgi:hypothetical protein
MCRYGGCVALSDADTAPFQKWAGGKRWLAPKIQRLIPPKYNTYIEPFLGSAAAFFAIEPNKAILSDTNGPIYLDLALPGDVVSSRDFQKIFSRTQTKDDTFTIENFPPGSSGEAQLREHLISDLRITE